MTSVPRSLGRREISLGGCGRTSRLRLRVAGLIGLVGLAALLLGGAVAGAQTSVTLASNLGQQTASGYFGFGDEVGQLFTTGSDTGGYTLTQLILDVQVVAPNGNQPNYRMELWTVNGSGTPQKKLTTLTNPSSLTANGQTTWTFGSGGYSVGANTTYAVLWDVLDPPGSINLRVRATDSNSEDSGSWQIRNSALKRAKTATTWGSDNKSMKIKIVGHKNPTPTAAPPPDPPNLARGDIQPSGSGGTQSYVLSERAGLLGLVGSRAAPGGGTGIHAVPVLTSEIRSNKPSGASGSLDLRGISASVSEELRRHSRGFYLTVMVEPVTSQRHLFRSGTVLNAEGQGYELAHDAPLLKVRIWHVYHHTGRGTNSIELLGEVFGGRSGDRLAEPVEVCLPPPSRGVERAQIAVRGRLDRHWTVLDSYLTFEDQLCAETTRVSWFTIVIEPDLEAESA